VGLIVGIWHFAETNGDVLLGNPPSAVLALGRRLEATTGLRVEEQPEKAVNSEPAGSESVTFSNTLRIPTLRKELFVWAFDDRTVEVQSLTPAHPYLWENLDAVMTASGGRRDTAARCWQPDPAHAWLRTRWGTLSSRDRFLLAMPSFLGARPFDRLLSTGH